jgi:hypothetical protein
MRSTKEDAGFVQTVTRIGGYHTFSRSICFVKRIAILVSVVTHVAASFAADPDEAWVRWNPPSDHIVSHTDQAAAYPRAKRLSNGEILLGYHHGGGLGEYGTFVTLRRSRDGGRSWWDTRDIEMPEPPEFWGFSNVDFIEIAPGRILLVTAARGKALPDEPEFLGECQRSALRIRMSDDFGVTWSAPMHVGKGRGRVWEPSVVRLADGAIEIYYANEAPDLAFPDRLDQRIELIRSSDGGRTWSEPVTISQHAGRRNGMPAALALVNGRVACAQEVVRDRHSPFIAQTLQGKTVEEYVAQTEYAFGAAPYLLRAPDGTTLLAFHSGFHKPPAPENATVPWMFTNVWVQRGDADAKNFRTITRPWGEIDALEGLFFPSLFMKDTDTVVALASFLTHHRDGSSTTQIRWIEGTFLRKEGTRRE